MVGRLQFQKALLYTSILLQRNISLLNMSWIMAFFFLYILVTDSFGHRYKVKSRKQLCNKRGYPVTCAFDKEAEMYHYGCMSLRCGSLEGNNIYGLKMLTLIIPDGTVCGPSSICLMGYCMDIEPSNMPTLEYEEGICTCFTQQELIEMDLLVKESESC